jgi:threonine dehydratase
MSHVGRDMNTQIDLAAIASAKKSLEPYLVHTPVMNWPSVGALASELGESYRDAQISAKLELFQVTGTFKPRGALMVMLQLSPQDRARGVVAASAGNHAIAVAYAASVLGISARIFVPQHMNVARRTACERYGQKLEYTPDIHAAFAHAAEVSKSEGRTFVHPYEGQFTALGTATLGEEFHSQVPDMEVLLVAVGGGGLAAGVARAAKLLNPAIRVIGVEPFGADSLWQSFQKGVPVEIEKVTTIADTLGAPRALPFSFALCRENLDKVVRVTDEQIRAGMRFCFDDLKLAVEPAGAAVVAALAGPLREELHGKKIGLIICGSNIDQQSFADHLAHR